MLSGRPLLLDLPRVHAALAAGAVPATVRQRVLADATAALGVGLLTVTAKTAAPPSGDRRDYVSVGPYWWPDATKPDGLPYVRRDGLVHPAAHSERYDRDRLDLFATTVVKLAYAALLEPQGPYARQAAAMLHTWFVDPGTRMNPNMQFAQEIPGVCTGRGIGLIESRVFVAVLDAAVILHEQGALPAADWQALLTWVGDFLAWMLTHPYGIAERGEHNNHGTWCDVQLAAFALFTGRTDVAREVLAQVPERRIAQHLAPDGRQPHELRRTRSLSYSAMNLNGLFALAWLGRQVGLDLWHFATPDGRSLRAGLAFLAPYADPATAWPYTEVFADGRPGDFAALPPSRTPVQELLLQAAIAWQEPAYRAHVQPALTDPLASLRWS